jgi:tRNA threonylcarbamoyladenosine biosynthesis protein TsaB
MLALEFSSAQRSAAVLLDELLAGQVQDPTFPGPGPLALVARALEQAGQEREAVERLAVGLGPGSYTGVRAAIALAQGWHLALGVPVAGVSSVEALAWQAAQTGGRGTAGLVVDAQRGEFYWARYDLGADGARLVEPLRLVPRETVESQLRAGLPVYGPGVDQWFVGGRSLFPTAQGVGLLAARGVAVSPPEKLEPIYLREARFVKAPPPRFAASDDAQG